LGGLARKATILEQLNNEGISPLILDAGYLLFKKMSSYRFNVFLENILGCLIPG
jgi:hypothetical protein